jgi:hypothetical protein
MSIQISIVKKEHLLCAIYRMLSLNLIKEKLVVMEISFESSVYIQVLCEHMGY